MPPKKSSSPKPKKRKAEQSQEEPLCDPVKKFYADKTYFIDNNRLPVVEMLKNMDPVPERSDLKRFLNLEFGVNCGKNLIYNKDGKKGGKKLIASCMSCIKFKCVWRKTKNVAFKFREDESDLEHGSYNEQGTVDVCGTLSHQATSVSDCLYCSL
jgi:hypothetical protein